MSEGKFDLLVHATNRLQICSILAMAAEIEFKVLREKLDVSESVLSKHLKALNEANYVSFAKRTALGRQRTWLSLTDVGRKAYAGHVEALKAIVGEV